MTDQNKPKKSLAGWVRRHRADIDAVIRSQCTNYGRINDRERGDWVSNDEGLYLWALRDGVDV
jgi:hypothetical protein